MERKDIYSPKKVFQVCWELPQEEALQERKREPGRPPSYPDHLYIALPLFRVFFSLPFRDVKPIFEDLFTNTLCPSFTALHRFLKTKVYPQRLEWLLKRLWERFSPFLPREGFLRILDTTGMPYRRKGQTLKRRRGREIRKVRSHKRLYVLIRYYPDDKVLVVEGLKVGEGLCFRYMVRKGGLEGSMWSCSFTC